MQPRLLPATAILLAALGCPAQTPTQLLTVPAAHATAEANSLLWVAGTGSDVRQMTLIGQSHLGALLGRELIALEIRRAAFDAAFAGSTTDWTVTLSHSPNDPLASDRVMQNNVGPSPVVVFAGQVTAPASPADTSNAVPWSAQNTIRVAFQTPFVYQGGTLCVDIVGLAIAGHTSNWWVGDAVFEDIQGTSNEIGAGCGAFGGSSHAWAGVSDRTLLPGAYAQFRAHGPADGFAVAVHGLPGAGPIPLASLGVPAPGCYVHLDPNLVLSAQIARFEPDTHPLWPATHGTANAFVRLPGDPWIFGLSLATQWLDLNQPATSNAIAWTVANQIPTLDMAYIDGVPGEPIGLVTVHHAPVYRFEHR